MTAVRVTARGAERWVRGHPWIYRSDVLDDQSPAGIVPVCDPRGRFIGQALHSPASEIRLRLLERTDAPVDAGWWIGRLAAAAARREGIDASGYRLVHAEGDGLPSLVLDRYDRWIVAQFLSAGLETVRDDILEAVQAAFAPEGILLRNDAPVRRLFRAALVQGVEATWPEMQRSGLTQAELGWIAQGLNANGREKESGWLRARRDSQPQTS